MEDRERLAASRWETRDTVVVASSAGRGWGEEWREEVEEASSEDEDIAELTYSKLTPIIINHFQLG